MCKQVQVLSKLLSLFIQRIFNNLNRKNIINVYKLSSGVGYYQNNIYKPTNPITYFSKIKT